MQMTDIVTARAVGEQIRSMSINIYRFSTCMWSLYEDEGRVFFTEEGIILRDDIMNDAMQCLRYVLPISTMFLAPISDFFEFYEDLEYEQWCRQIPGLVKKAAKYRHRGEKLVRMYEESLVFLKERLEERQDQARLIVTEMRQLKENFERKKKKLEDTASTKRDFAFILLFVPVVNLIAFPLLEASAESDHKEANANGAQAAIQEVAVTKLSN